MEFIVQGLWGLTEFLFHLGISSPCLPPKSSSTLLSVLEEVEQVQNSYPSKLSWLSRAMLEAIGRALINLHWANMSSLNYMNLFNLMTFRFSWSHIVHQLQSVLSLGPWGSWWKLTFGWWREDKFQLFHRRSFDLKWIMTGFSQARLVISLPKYVSKEHFCCLLLKINS